MSRIALVVDIEVADGGMAEYLPEVKAHAGRTLANEPGCLQFDVLQPHDGGNRVMLFEMYRDGAALEAHRASDHLKRYREMAQRLVARQSVTICDVAD